ncbi:MAG TPA: sulfite oxidase-like oxidoreductase [Bacillota bacterium]
MPPGQRLTTKFPVLHAGSVPRIDPDTWRLKVTGLIAQPFEMTLEELKALPAVSIKADIHCVTGWSKFDTKWTGATGREVLRRCRPTSEARFVMIHAPGWSTNLPLADLDRDDVIFAWDYAGEPVEADHGGPLRLVVPHLYFWKSAKWVEGVELIAENRPGYWERGGYHMRGDPWREQRYRDDW